MVLVMQRWQPVVTLKILYETEPGRMKPEKAVGMGDLREPGAADGRRRCVKA